MDGTIVDTEPYWMDAEQALVAEWGGTWTHEQALELVGQGLWHSARILRAAGVGLAEDALVEALTATVIERIRVRVPWRPGAIELLTELRDLGVPTALVTMSLRSMAEVVVESMGFPAFDVIVSGDDVQHAKPHPEPYLRAAELLGVEITECVALEDSPTGLASAIESGAVAVGIPLMIDIPEHHTHTVWQSLAGRTAADVAALYTTSTAGRTP
jgi:HAD superfamily hydrolase (TIGR01509 family)